MAANQTRTPLVAIHWGRFLDFVTALPLLSCLAAVFIATVWHFENTTWTDCEVPNYLPSISAAIGGNMPEKFIWRVGIALHCFPRIFVFTLVFYKHHKNTQSGKKYNSTTWWFKWLNRLVSTLHVVENSALLTLTYVSSSEDFDVHEGSFIAFMVCAMIYMLLSCIMFKLTASQPMSVEETTLLQKKICLMLTNYCSFGLAVYCYFRHNEHCEPGMYTLFAVLEYCTIVSNIAFHWYCHWPFSGARITVSYDDFEMSKTS